MHRIFRCLHLRRQSLAEAELRVRPSLPSDACGMPGIGACLEQSAGIALFINRLLIEQQGGRQTGLMHQQLAYRNILLVRILQERQIG